MLVERQDGVTGIKNAAAPATTPEKP